MEDRVFALRALNEQLPASKLDRREHILATARDLMVQQGVGAVTVRGVARAAGMAPGNLGYYFANLDELIHALLDWVLAPYLSAFQFLLADTAGDPIASLRAVLKYVLDDLSSENTTKFFPELWVLANRSERSALRMRELYDTYMDVLKKLVGAARPDFTDQQIDEMALFVCASIEGQTVFIGFERPYQKSRAAVQAIALNAMVTTVMYYDRESYDREDSL